MALQTQTISIPTRKWIIGYLWWVKVHSIWNIFFLLKSPLSALHAFLSRKKSINMSHLDFPLRNKSFSNDSSPYHNFLILGLIVGAIIRYTVVITPVTHLRVLPANDSYHNLTIPPDDLWLGFSYRGENKTYDYKFHGEVTDKNDVIDLKVRYVSACLLSR